MPFAACKDKFRKNTANLRLGYRYTEAVFQGNVCFAAILAPTTRVWVERSNIIDREFGKKRSIPVAG